MTGPPGESGFVAGLEALAFGVLVFVVGTLLLVNGWAVVDAKFATNAAAREAVRAVVESPPLEPGALLAVAESAAAQAVAAHGHPTDALSVSVAAGSTLTQRRCAPVRIVATLVVRATTLPGIAAPVSTTVTSVHEEVIDPFRSGLSVLEGLDEGEPGGPCGF